MILASFTFTCITFKACYASITFIRNLYYTDLLKTLSFSHYYGGVYFTFLLYRYKVRSINILHTTYEIPYYELLTKSVMPNPFCSRAGLAFFRVFAGHFSFLWIKHHFWSPITLMNNFEMVITFSWYFFTNFKIQKFQKVVSESFCEPDWRSFRAGSGPRAGGWASSHMFKLLTNKNKIGEEWSAKHTFAHNFSLSTAFHET